MLYTSWMQMSLIYLFFVGALSFVWNKGHLLASLINLEYMALILFITISLFYMYSDLMLLTLMYLTISVCEGALGLSVLVVYARGSGGDFMGGSMLSSW